MAVSTPTPTSKLPFSFPTGFTGTFTESPAIDYDDRWQHLRIVIIVNSGVMKG
jgi:hypothetical protein